MLQPVCLCQWQWGLKPENLLEGFLGMLGIQIRDLDPSLPHLGFSWVVSLFSKMQPYRIQWQEWLRKTTPPRFTHVGVGNDSFIAREDTEANFPVHWSARVQQHGETKGRAVLATGQVTLCPCPSRGREGWARQFSISKGTSFKLNLMPSCDSWSWMDFLFSNTKNIF